MRYRHIIAEVIRTPWAIRQEKLEIIQALLSRKAGGEDLSEEEIAAIRETTRIPFRIECHEHPPKDEELNILPAEAVEWEVQELAQNNEVSRSTAPVIAVLPLFGTIMHRMGGLDEYSGGTSTERFATWFRSAMADSTVKSIVIDVDSPGGTVNGVPELADEIFQGRGTKQVVAVANSQAASAAYYLASQASEFVVIPSGEVGSIGVYAAHVDLSQALEKEGAKVSLVSFGKYKTEANPYEPLSEEARAMLQERVDKFGRMFVNAVARGRNTDAANVNANFGQGRMMLADDAKQAGMVDRVSTMERTLRRLGAKTRVRTLPESLKQESEPVPVQQAVPAHVVARRRRERELALYS